MARVYKFEGYIVDVNEDFKDVYDFLSYLNNRLRYGHVTTFNDKTSEDFEWYDEIPINKYGCNQEDFEKFFQKGLTNTEK